MTLAALLLAAVALALAAYALVTARRNRCQAPPPPTREERIAQARGAIEACRGAELALEGHGGELVAACLLAGHRARAAQAKHELRALGVDP